jgi:hypothetical protein
MSDKINPPYYKKGGIENIDIYKRKYSSQHYYGGLMMQADNYLDRHLDKGDPIGDLEKLIWYAQKMIEWHKEQSGDLAVEELIMHQYDDIEEE